MTLDEYQAAALKTALKSGDDFKDLMHWVLGTAGEAGEIAEKVKKAIRDTNGEVSDSTKAELVKELGDVLWHLAVMADHLGYNFEEVAQVNIDKLRSRWDRDMIHGAGDNR